MVTKRIQGTKGYTRLRKDDLDQRFPGLMDSLAGARRWAERPSPGRTPAIRSSGSPHGWQDGIQDRWQASPARPSSVTRGVHAGAGGTCSPAAD